MSFALRSDTSPLQLAPETHSFRASSFDGDVQFTVDPPAWADDRRDKVAR